jgi:uncharacterized protein GlcG (DUF336 family)
MSHARAVLIDLARARTIVDRALGHARANDFPPMTVTMLDTAGALGLRPAKTDPACCVGVSRGPRHAAPSTWASAAEAWQPERRPTPRSSTQWSPSLMATLCPPPAGCSRAATTTTSSARSGSLPDDDEACAIHGIAAAGLCADRGAADPT